MAVFKHIRETIEFHARQRRIYSELQAMSDRELNDLNIGRGMLQELSREAARNA